MRATTLGAVDLRGIHQATNGGQAKSQCAAGAESIAKARFDIRDTGSLIDRAYAHALLAILEERLDADHAMSGVLHDVAGEFRHHGAKQGTLVVGEGPQAPGALGNGHRCQRGITVVPNRELERRLRVGRHACAAEAACAFILRSAIAKASRSVAVVRT